MSIKQSIVAFLLLVSVSFSAFADQWYDHVSMSSSVKSCFPAYPISSSEISSCSVTTHNGALRNCKVEESEISGIFYFKCQDFRDSGTEWFEKFGRLKIHHCPEGQIVNPATRQCETPPPCSALEGEDAPWPVGHLPNDDKPITAQRLYCDTYKMCEAVAGYTAYQTTLGPTIIKDSYYTGGKCSDNFSGNDDCQYMGTSCDTPAPPEPELEDPYPGCKKPYVEVPFVCPEDTDGDGIPNPDAPFDDAANCSHDESGKFSCTGGTFDPETPNPNPDPDPNPEPNPDPDPDGPIVIPDPNPLPPSTNQPLVPDPVDPEAPVTEPELTPGSNGDIVKSIVNLNKDTNKALRDLNIDINKSNASINTQLVALNSNVRQNSETIQDLHKANIDISTREQELMIGTTNAIKSGNAALGEKLNAVNGNLSDIGDGLDKIINTDTSGAGIGGTCIATDSCTGFYDSAYPEGINGLLSGQMTKMKTDVLDPFVATFNIDVSGAQRPKFGLPVPFYGWFYFDDFIDMDWIFSFIRFVFITSTVFYSRQIIFGG